MPFVNTGGGWSEGQDHVIRKHAASPRIWRRFRAAKEYRIEDGNVEGRTLDPEGGSPRHTGSVWWRLTPEQLSIHLECNTVVAQWLERRLGWRRLLQACVGQEASMWKVAENTNHPAL